MPYFVYKVFAQPEANNLVEYIDKFQGYRDARTQARSLRSELPKDCDYIVKMIFAKDTVEAEKLLSVPRDERVIGEE
ncbi:MAG: hypothetical protein KZQ58_02675 [gamma proteobacterium symbiont of Bathyaustriella thionipta]|nr:hypothetical protein [gamma proteobacterium symbiont of Bathyaustriella thionipta]